MAFCPIQPIQAQRGSSIPQTELSWRSSSTVDLWQEWEPQGAIGGGFSSWLPARGCGLRGEGVDKGHCSAATVTFSYADLQQECTLWPCSCFHMLPWLSATPHAHAWHRAGTHSPCPYCTGGQWAPLQPCCCSSARQHSNQMCSPRHAAWLWQPDTPCLNSK